MQTSVPAPWKMLLHREAENTVTGRGKGVFPVLRGDENSGRGSASNRTVLLKEVTSKPQLGRLPP